MRTVKSFVAVLVIASASFACGGGPTAPSPKPPVVNPPVVQPPNPGPTPVYAPPPQGVSAEMWRVAFSTADAKLRGLPESVHLSLPEGIDEATIGLLREYVEEMNTWGLQTRYSLESGNVTIPISVVPGLLCAGKPAGGCMSPSYDSSGRLVGGWIKFEDVVFMKQKAVFFHEAIRCLGIEMSSPEAGVLANPASGPRPTEAELALLRARYNYPLLAVYAAQ